MTEKYFFDESRANRVIAFFENYLFHVKGKWAGRPFKLLNWQKEELIKPLFGWVDESGKRKHRTAFIFVPRKNGKSSLAAGIALYLLCADGEQGAEIYSAANDRDQARIVFDAAVRMVELSPYLRKRLKVYKHSIVYEKTGSVYRVISADAYTKHGYNAHGVIYDELHAAQSRELFDVLSTSTGAREQPLTFVITTAGSSVNSICYELYDYAKKVKEGVINDDSFFALIYEADKPDDWKDPHVWKKANPSLGETLSPEYLEQQVRQAENMPGKIATFKRLHLNIWTQEQSKWIDLKVWDEGNLHPIDEEKLGGLPCFGGLDLSSTHDVTAWVLVFHHEDEQGDYHLDVLPRFFVPEAKLTDERNKFRYEYQKWVEKGLMTVIPGNVIDYRVVKKQIVADLTQYNVISVNVDRLFQGHQLIVELQEEGFKIVPFGQGFYSMSAPTKETERLILARKLNHGGNPVLRFMIDSTCVKTDPAGNIKPDKASSTGKIDGVVATIMAVDRWQREIGLEKERSVYDERGILFI
jgi:phage terminase large subunit-like protein